MFIDAVEVVAETIEDVTVGIDTIGIKSVIITTEDSEKNVTNILIQDINDGKCFNCLSSKHQKKDCPEPP